MESKYGQISESNDKNLIIYACFNYLNEREQRKFLTKFIGYQHSKQQFNQTVNELILGTYLSKNDYIVEYDRKIDRQKPDWSIKNKSQSIIAIIETVTHQIDDETKYYIEAQHKSGKIAVGYKPDRNDPEHIRLYSRILKKATGYKDLITGLDIPYVVAVCIDNLAEIYIQETIECITIGEESLFKHCPYLSGVLHFLDVSGGKYGFWYIENQYASHKINIPSGYFEISTAF